jgi:carbonic anhydrase
MADSDSASQGCGGVSRRSFLGGSVTGIAGSILGGVSMEIFDVETLEAQTNMTPDESLRHLMEGNERFVSGKLTELNTSLNLIRQRTVEKQEPFAAVLSCADSRVPVELVFDQTIGELFVARVAGNFTTPEITGTLEYGVAVLGTRVLMVLGHSGCGAVQATMDAKTVPGEISSLFEHIQPAVDVSGGDLEKAIKENARRQAKLLGESSPVLSGFVKEGKLKIVAGYYDLGTGKVSLLEG